MAIQRSGFLLLLLTIYYRLGQTLDVHQASSPEKDFVILFQLSSILGRIQNELLERLQIVNVFQIEALIKSFCPKI